MPERAGDNDDLALALLSFLGQFRILAQYLFVSPFCRSGSLRALEARRFPIRND